MKNAQGQQVNGLGRTMTMPDKGQQISLNLTPKENCGRRMRLQLNDPAGLIEEVEFVRETGVRVVQI